MTISVFAVLSHAAGASLVTTDHLFLGALRSVVRSRSLHLDGEALDLIRRLHSARDIVAYKLDSARG